MSLPALENHATPDHRRTGLTAGRLPAWKTQINPICLVRLMGVERTLAVQIEVVQARAGHAQ
jgi:hypothetical protein